jgi:amino acid transporter
MAQPAARGIRIVIGTRSSVTPSAAALIFFAYLRFDEIGNFAEEMHQPQRNLPRALFFLMAGTTLIYLLVALSPSAGKISVRRRRRWRWWPGRSWDRRPTPRSA